MFRDISVTHVPRQNIPVSETIPVQVPRSELPICALDNADTSGIPGGRQRGGRATVRGMVEGATRRSFGYKTAWIAARDVDPEVVADALGLLDRDAATWSTGVGAAYEAGVFVCPPVEGWVMAMGLDILLDPPDLANLSLNLSTEVQLFYSHRVSESHHWSLARGGVVVRAFEFNFDGGQLTANAGPPTAVEAATPEIAPALPSEPGTFPFDAYEGLDHPTSFPDEGSVMTVAAAWSLDPTQLSGEDDRLGIYGRRRFQSGPPTRSGASRRKWRLRK